MSTAERVILLALTFTLIAGGYGGYWLVQDRRDDIRAAVAAGEYERPLATTTTPQEVNGGEADWRRWYPVTYPMQIGSTTVQASIADTISERIKGLSGTPYLPDDVVKLFAFGTAGTHSIWMKDMQYVIDILWLDQDGYIVHIEEAVSPTTYDPAAPHLSVTYASPVPAWFVVETNAGFVAEHVVEVGDRAVLIEAI